MATAAISAATAITAALTSIARRNPASNTAGSWKASPVSPASGGSAATASSVPLRATALFTPLAVPAYRSSALASTVEVSGATTADSPSPNTVTAGRTCNTYEEPGPIVLMSRNPAPATRMPIVIGPRGPCLLASSPADGDSSSIRPVTGSSADAAATGENPDTT